MNILLPTFRELLKSCWPWRTTAQQSQSLLRLIAVAAEENLPLCPLLESWALDERGRQRRRLFRVVRLLKAGTSLTDAVEQVPGLLRDEEILALRFDALSGIRTASVRAILDEALPSYASRPFGVRTTLIYFSVVLPISLLIVLFLQIKIIPNLLRIASDFAIPQLPVLTWSRYFSDLVADWIWLILLAICAALWPVYSTRAGRFVRRAMLGSTFNPWRDTYVADVLRKLGVAAGSGRPLTGALSTLARFHFDPVIRHKLLFVRNEVEQGTDVWQSMNTVGFLTVPEVRLLNTAARVGNSAWTLGQLADVKQSRTARRWQRRATFVLPSFVLLMGGFVLFQALTVFLPLIEFLTAI